MVQVAAQAPQPVAVQPTPSQASAPQPIAQLAWTPQASTPQASTPQAASTLTAPGHAGAARPMVVAGPSKQGPQVQLQQLTLELQRMLQQQEVTEPQMLRNLTAEVQVGDNDVGEDSAFGAAELTSDQDDEDRGGSAAAAAQPEQLLLAVLKVGRDMISQLQEVMKGAHQQAQALHQRMTDVGMTVQQQLKGSHGRVACEEDAHVSSDSREELQAEAEKLLAQVAELTACQARLEGELTSCKQQHAEEVAELQQDVDFLTAMKTDALRVIAARDATITAKDAFIAGMQSMRRSSGGGRG